MEIFVDGGLFELLLAVAFGYALNFIFFRKYLLIIFSALSVLAPIALFFLPPGELRYFITGICFINSILLVVLLWKQRMYFPNEPLFDVEKWKKKFYFKHLPRVTREPANGKELKMQK
jgi:hypothetical protein